MAPVFAGAIVLVKIENDILAVHTLSRPETLKEHSDPFDRLLLAQAKIENLALLTHDELLLKGEIFNDY